MKNLKRLRKQAGITQFALARKTKIHRWRISHAEQGILDLAPDEVARIRGVLLDAARKKSADVLKELAPGDAVR